MRPGQLVWVDLDPIRGHEQRGHRPALVISEQMRSIAIVVPLTTASPKMPAHHRMSGEQPSTALCEQVRAIDVQRVTKAMGGAADPEDLEAVRRIVARLIGVWR